MAHQLTRPEPTRAELIDAGIEVPPQTAKQTRQVEADRSKKQQGDRSPLTLDSTDG